MKYRVTKKRNKSGKEKTLITDDIEKAEKNIYQVVKQIILHY